MKTALLVVDIQNDFLPGGALAVPAGDEIIPYVVELMRKEHHYRLIVASQDWHPAGHGSFASTHPGAEPFQTGILGGLAQIYWPDHCVQGSQGALIAAQIIETFYEISKKGMSTLIIQKGMDKDVDSYSAFFDNARKRDTGLHKALQSHNIDALDVVGLAFDYCVKATALDAVSLGYSTRILRAGTREIDSSGVDQLMRELNDAGVECV